MRRLLRRFLGIDRIIRNQEQIMSALDDLTTQVSQVETSIGAAIALISDASGDATQLAALALRLKNVTTALDAAVAAHATAASS